MVGHWEQSYNAPLTEAPMWAYPLRDFGITDWRMWPVSGIRCPESKVALTEANDIDSLLPETGPRVYVEPRGYFNDESIDLHEFEHPADAVYVFGSAHFNPTVGGRVNPEDSIVTIRTVEDAGVLWPHQALVTVLHDRLVKSWR